MARNVPFTRHERGVPSDTDIAAESSDLNERDPFPNDSEIEIPHLEECDDRPSGSDSVMEIADGDEHGLFPSGFVAAKVSVVVKSQTSERPCSNGISVEDLDPNERGPFTHQRAGLILTEIQAGGVTVVFEEDWNSKRFMEGISPEELYEKPKPK